MEQHSVPQNITGFQFKLVGDMTPKQFAYLASGVILGYLFTLLPWAKILKYPLAGFSGFLGFALAFMPIEERPLDRWIVAFFHSVYAPTQFIWKKNPLSLDWYTFTSTVPAVSPSSTQTVINVGQLQEYLKSLPNAPQSPIDKTESAAIKSLDFSIGDELIPPPAPVPQMPFIPVPPPLPEDSGPALPRVRVRKLKASLKGEIILPPLTKKKIVDITLPTLNLPKPEPKIKEKVLAPQRPSTIIASAIPPVPPKNLSPQANNDEIYPNIAPQKTNPSPEPKKTENPVPSTAKEELRRLKSQNDLLNDQMKKFQEQISALQEFAVQTSEGKIRLKEMLSKYEDAQRQKDRAIQELSTLKRTVEENKKQAVKPTVAQVQTAPRVQFIPDQSAKKQGVPTTPQFPNVIAGIITDSAGNILSNVIITVKDIHDNPVRALKSNQLGQFKTGTPLLNGSYTIELEKEGYEFDIIAMEVKGDVIPLLEIKAK